MSPRITVSGFRKPRLPPRPRRVRTWVVPIRPMNLLWLVPVLAVPLLPSLPGLPTLPDLSGTPGLLLFSMSTGEGALRYYTECAYLGLDGSLSHLHGPSCPTVRFLKPGRN